MKHGLCIVICLVGFARMSFGDESPVQSADMKFFESKIRPVLVKHCYECHGDGSSKGELALDELGTDFSDAEIMRLWVLVHDRVTSGEMPPKKKPPFF